MESIPISPRLRLRHRLHRKLWYGTRCKARECHLTNAVVVSQPQACAVRSHGRVPREELVQREGAVLLHDPGAAVAIHGLVVPSAG